jgi:hypothetical protein
MRQNSGAGKGGDFPYLRSSGLPSRKPGNMGSGKGEKLSLITCLQISGTSHMSPLTLHSHVTRQSAHSANSELETERR